MCENEKDYLDGKPQTVLTELEFAKASIKRMNIRSKKLDEILRSQKTDLQKTRLGYTYGASMSMDKGKYVFVQGPNIHSLTPIYSNSTHLNTVKCQEMCQSPSLYPSIIFVGSKSTLDHIIINYKII